jgi:hypothetical protein
MIGDAVPKIPPSPHLGTRLASARAPACFQPSCGAKMPDCTTIETSGSEPTLPLHAAADLQDHLMTASNDLDRLQRLLSDASDSLLGHFYGASGRLNHLLQTLARHPEVEGSQLHEVMQHMAGAITAMQFQDMASQLIHHTNTRLRSCADRLAQEAMGDDDEDGAAVVQQAPTRPNPVTQDEMDAGSIELF